MKSFFQPVVKMLQSQVDAGDGDSLSGVRIAVVDTNSQPTGKVYESGPTNSAPTEVVTGGNINTVMAAAGGAGWEKVQATTASFAITKPTSGGGLDLHIEVGGSLAALNSTAWPVPTSGVGQLRIRNFSGSAKTLTAGTGWTIVTADGNPITGGSYSIPDDRAVEITLDPDGFAQVVPWGGEVNQAEFAGHTGDVANPHGVTKTQVGLGNVENLASIQRDTGLWIPAMMTRAIDLDFESLPDGAVSTIVNTGSLGGSAGQATVAQQPVVAVDTSGRKGADFDGSNDWLESSAAWQLGATGYGIFAVFRYDGGKGYLIAEEYNADDVLYTLGLDAANSLYVGHFNGAWRKSNTAAITTGDLVVAIGNYDGANFNIRTFGADSLLAQTSSPDGLTTLKTRIGRRWDGAVGAADSHFNGRIFRLLVKDGAFTADEINSLEAWAVRHFGLETKVVRPVNHTHPTATASVTGLMSSTAMSKLDGIASGAEVNIQPDWNQATTTADDFIKNKPTIAALEGTTVPVMDGTAAVGTATTASKSNHVHPSDTSKAPMASPTFTGTPAAPTATSGTNTTQVATTAFVKTAVDTAVTGLLDYRGAFTPAASSGSTGYPSTGGSGTSGAILKGDVFVASSAGFILTEAIQAGDSVLAKIDSPGQAAANWDKLNANVTYVPEDQANRRTAFQATPDDTHYPSEKLVKDQLDTKQATLVSATNIKTVGGTAILGSGDIPFPAFATSLRLMTPTDIIEDTDRAIYLLAEDLALGAVSTWANPGTGGDFTQATAGSQPTVEAVAALGGRKAALFADDFMEAANISLGTRYGLFAVFIPSNITTNHYILAETYVSTVEYMFGTQAAQFNVGHFNGAWRDFRPASPVPVANTPYILVAGYDGANLQIKVDGGTASTAAQTSNPTLTDAGNIRLGRRWDGTTDIFDGHIACVVAKRNAYFTATEIAQLEGFAAWFFGRVAALPSGHTYKNSPPLIAV